MGADVNPLEICARVAFGFSFVLFLWLRYSMRSCEGLMRVAFRAMRIGVESPWPKFPDKTVDDRTVRLHMWRNRLCFVVAFCLSSVSLAVFLHWSLRQIPSFVRLFDRVLSHSPAFMPIVQKASTFLATLDTWWWALWIGSVAIFLFWLIFKERVLKAILTGARTKWPSPGEVVKRGHEPEQLGLFFQLPESVREQMVVRWVRWIWWVFSG
jgi:hypothetical protein